MLRPSRHPWPPHRATTGYHEKLHALSPALRYACGIRSRKYVYICHSAPCLQNYNRRLATSIRLALGLPIAGTAHRGVLACTGSTTVPMRKEVNKCKFLYSAISGPQDCSKHFPFYFPDRPVQSDTVSTSLASIQPYATINA